MSFQKPMMKIALLAYDGCLGSQLFGVVDTLLLATKIFNTLERNEEKVFDIHVISVKKSTIRLAGDTKIQAKKPQGKYDLLIVPAPEINAHEDWEKTLSKLKPELAFLKSSFAKGTSLASICVGAFLFGEAGLIDDRKVTTAWLVADDLAKRYPHCHLNTKDILVEDGAIITAGAMNATFDLAIYIIKHAISAKIATATARISLLESNRTSQAPYIDPTLPFNSTPTFSRSIQQWLIDRLLEPFDLENLADAFHISSRTLLRRVKAETGKTPLNLLQQARVNKAKQLLVNKNWSIARITEEIGYKDVSSFTLLFTRLVGESPAQYRKRV